MCRSKEGSRAYRDKVDHTVSPTTCHDNNTMRLPLQLPTFLVQAQDSFLLLVLVLTGVHGFSMSSKTSSINSSTGSPYCLNVQLEIQPDRRDEFLRSICRDGKGALKTEQGCLQYVLGEDVEIPNRFYLHEQYRSLEDFQVHQSQAYYKEWKAFGATDPWKPGTTPVVQFFQATREPVYKNDIPTPAYCLNVQLCIRPQVRDEFLAVIRQNQKGSNHDEPACWQYDWGESTKEPNTFYFHEQYRDLAGFQAHAQAPHFKKWETFAATQPFTSPPVVQFYQSIPILKQE